jgi:UDP-glucose:(heptosyl)LPS alpha-1,3-glucosyltransferase
LARTNYGLHLIPLEYFMKIALVRKSYTPYGGAERYLSQLIERLSRQGHEVHVFANRWQEGKKERAEAPVFFHRVPMIGAPSFMEALSFALFSKRLLQAENLDVIHSFERTLYQDIYRAGDGCHREWLIQRRKIDPWLRRVAHPLNPLHRSLLFLEKNLFRSPKLQRIIANSQKGKEEIIRHYGVPPEKIEVIYNGVDLDVFHPKNVALYRKSIRKELKIDPEAFVVLFLGSGFRRKGLGSLISSFPQIKREIPGARLLVAGKDRIRGYREEARRLGVAEAVRFLGRTQRAKELYAASDLFALPTIYDPFSNACLEAMATGIPVLTTRQNGVAELIESKKGGFLLEDPQNHLEIAEKVLGFFHSPSRITLGEEARKTSEGLDFDSAIRRLLPIYEAIKKE